MPNLQELYSHANVDHPDWNLWNSVLWVYDYSVNWNVTTTHVVITLDSLLKKDKSNA